MTKPWSETSKCLQALRTLIVCFKGSLTLYKLYLNEFVCMLGVAYLNDFPKRLSLSFQLVISLSSLLDKVNHE